MTIYDIYKYVLIENNKAEAPSLLLDDFIYFYNKSVQQYANKIYNFSEINQQARDDLSFLNERVLLSLIKENEFTNRYIAVLPEDYFHLLKCTVEFNSVNNCGENKIYIGAKVLPSDLDNQVENNFYFKPCLKRPYYTIFNNKTIEIKCGDASPNKIEIVYVKTPDKISFTNEDLNNWEFEDTSQVLPFPNYVCYEILNELMKLILEHNSDSRLNTNIPINQTIGRNINNNK